MAKARISLMENLSENISILKTAYENLLDRQIDDDDAKEFIKYHQKSNPNSLKSIWMNDSIIRALTNFPAGKFSGLRLYYAKYKKGVGNVGKPGGPKADDPTIVVSVTIQDSSGRHNDMAGNYFDYSKPCPPYNNGGLEFP